MRSGPWLIGLRVSAPYSAEIWLMKARVSGQRRDVIDALTVASVIAPNDRRVLRWIHSLQELDGPDQVPTAESPIAEVRPLPFVSAREPQVRSLKTSRHSKGRA